MTFAENVKIVEAIKPQTGASARSGDWVSLKNHRKCAIVVQIAMGNAATTAITVDKATSVSGTGESTGIAFGPYWANTTTQSTDTLTRTGSSSTTSITSSSAGTGAELYVIQINAEDLGNFDCVQVELGASNAANLVSATYYLYEPRFAQPIPPAAITD